MKHLIKHCFQLISVSLDVEWTTVLCWSVCDYVHTQMPQIENFFTAVWTIQFWSFRSSKIWIVSLPHVVLNLIVFKAFAGKNRRNLLGGKSFSCYFINFRQVLSPKLLNFISYYDFINISYTEGLGVNFVGLL